MSHDERRLHWRTRLIASNVHAPPDFRSLAPATHRGSTVVFERLGDAIDDWRQTGGYVYGLYGTPTTVELGLRIAEVPSFEKLRISGTTNLRTVRDGFRVLRAITTEWRDERVTRTSGSPHPAAPGRAARPTEAPPWHSNGRSAAEPSADGNGARIRSVGG